MDNNKVEITDRLLPVANDSIQCLLAMKEHSVPTKTQFEVNAPYIP